MAEIEEDLKSFSMQVKEESKKAVLNLSIQKVRSWIWFCHFMANRWRKKMETLRNFIFLGSKTSADRDCSHEINRHLLLGRKAMTNLDSMFKSRDITLPTEVPIVKVTVLPVVLYGWESWTYRRLSVKDLNL